MTTPLEAALELAPQVRGRWHDEYLPDPCPGCTVDVLLAAVEYAEQEIGRLRGALRRRIESDDAQEGGACDCAWCVEDRALVARLSEATP